MKDLVSCIMPTTSERKRFIPLAISYFLRQDYRNTELIILDDTDGSIRSLIPEADNIHYILAPDKFSSVGSKRNYACSLCKGNVILHWDDDDWYAPDWISKQTAFLQSSNLGICGLSSINFFDPVLDQHWHYVYGYNNTPWVAGATLAYRKAVWEQSPFRDLNIDEDKHFVWFSGTKVATHEYTEGFVSIIHENNTSPKCTKDVQWRQKPTSEIRRILGRDIGAYTR